MPWRDATNRSKEYRKRAGDCRAEASTATDEKARAMLMQDADAWERMAAWEDKHNPPRPVRRSTEPWAMR